jgi:hypothetical protein
LPFFHLALAVSRQNAHGCRHFGLENRKYFRCSWKWEIGTVSVAVRNYARNALENKAIALVRCYHTFPPVRPSMIVATSSFRNMPKINGKCATGRITLTVTAMMSLLICPSERLHHNWFQSQKRTLRPSRSKIVSSWQSPLNMGREMLTCFGSNRGHENPCGQLTKLCAITEKESMPTEYAE